MRTYQIKMASDSPTYKLNMKADDNLDENGKENETKPPRVHLDPTPRIMNPTPSSLPSSQQDDSAGTIPGCRPLAILLRIRVTQIVAGIVFVLLGTVACLESTTRHTLSVAIPAGALAVLTAVVNIQANRKEYSMGLLGTPTIHTSTFIWNNRTLISRLLTLACVGVCLLLLGLACLAAVSDSNKNKAALGCLQALTSMMILGTEAAVVALRWHWATKLQNP